MPTMPRAIRLKKAVSELAILCEQHEFARHTPAVSVERAQKCRFTPDWKRRIEALERRMCNVEDDVGLIGSNTFDAQPHPHPPHTH